MAKTKKKKAKAAAPAASGGWKKGDRVRVLRSAAEGWQGGAVQDASGGVAHTATLDQSGDVVGLAGVTWEAQP